MSGAWVGDWAGRIQQFAEREGFAGILDYLLAHPTLPLSVVAGKIGAAAPIQLDRLASRQAADSGRLAAMVLARAVRTLHDVLPRGWGTHGELAQAAIFWFSDLPEPWATLTKHLDRALAGPLAPPAGWLPASADDAVLLHAWDGAVSELDLEQQALVATGGFLLPPGTVYEKLITPLFDAVSIYDGPEVFLQQWQRAAPRARLLFAAHFCQSEVCNGGFFQFFDNSTGVLGPEAADGFAAIGQPGCAQVVREALAWFPAPYPRDRELRARCLRLGLPEAAAPHTLFEALDKRFYALLDSEAGGFDAAADRHASAAAGN